MLWCPFDHPARPETALFWRSAAEVADILDTPPEPPAIQFAGHLPEPCLLAPEQITEYPGIMEPSKELQQQLEDWRGWQAADPSPRNPTMLGLARGYDLQLYVCPVSPDHPHLELIR